MRTIIHAAMLAVPAAALLAACGGSDDAATPIAPVATTTTVSGSAVKGPVNGATVRAKKPDGTACGTATTNAQGTYSLETTCTGDLIIEVSGGTYTDEATNQSRALDTPLRVVEIFRTLEALCPGRIDLGLGRAPGTDPVTSAALRRADDPDVNQLLAELLAFERGEFPDRHPFRAITAMPSDVTAGTPWMLGSSLTGAQIAAQLGMRYAFAGHFAMRQAADALALYRRRFQPSPGLAAPYAMLAVTCVCGEDDDDAQRQAAPLRLAIVRTRTGQRAPIASIYAAASASVGTSASASQSSPSRSRYRPSAA